MQHYSADSNIINLPLFLYTVIQFDEVGELRASFGRQWVGASGRRPINACPQGSQDDS